MKRWLLCLCFLVLSFGYAEAQCSGSSGIPFNCAPGSAIGPNDIVLGGQGVNTVKFTATQIAQFAAAAGQPGVFSTLTVTNGGSLAGSFSGNFTFSGNVTFSGAATFGGGLSLSSITLSNSTITLLNTLFASLPPVTAANSGQIAFVTNCQNGSQGSGSGTGCIYAVDDTGTWVAYPSLPTQTLTIAGIAYYLGGTVTMQGVGAKVASATGSFVTGNAVTTNAAGTLIDSGVPPGGGGGGSGTVNNCATAGAPAYYAAAGTAASCPSVIDSAIWTSNASGVLTAATTLPSAQTAPTWTLSNPTVTGTMTISAATFSGALDDGGERCRRCELHAAARHSTHVTGQRQRVDGRGGHDLSRQWRDDRAGHRSGSAQRDGADRRYVWRVLVSDMRHDNERRTAHGDSAYGHIRRGCDLDQ